MDFCILGELSLSINPSGLVFDNEQQYPLTSFSVKVKVNLETIRQIIPVMLHWNGSVRHGPIKYPYEECCMG